MSAKRLRSTKRSRWSAANERRAQEIINAEGRFSAPFRAEIQDALVNWPHKLPALIAEAQRMEQRHGKKRIRKPLVRSKVNSTATYAERAESLFEQLSWDELDQRMTERAKLLSQILCDVSDEADVSVSHALLVRAYIIAIDRFAGRKPFVVTALRHAEQILDGCTDEEYRHIQDFWSDDPAVYGPAREADRCFAWHSKHFSGSTELRRDKAARSTSPAGRIDLTTLKRRADQLRGRLRIIHHLPEDESSRFQTQTELDAIEREIAAAEEWPDEIGGVL